MILDLLAIKEILRIAHSENPQVILAQEKITELIVKHQKELQNHLKAKR